MEAKASQKASKIERIFEKLSRLKKICVGIQGGSEGIRISLLGPIPGDEAKTERPPGVGSLEEILNQIGDIQYLCEKTREDIHFITAQIASRMGQPQPGDVIYPDNKMPFSGE